MSKMCNVWTKSVIRMPNFSLVSMLKIVLGADVRGVLSPAILQKSKNGSAIIVKLEYFEYFLDIMNRKRQIRASK